MEDLPCLRGRVGVVVAATERVCAISVQIYTEPSLVLALIDYVYEGASPATNLKRLEKKRIQFDAVQDLHSPYGSFWKAIHAWTVTKMQNTDPNEDWIKVLKPIYNSSKPEIQDLLTTCRQKVMEFLLKGVSLETHLLTGVHLQSLGTEKQAIQFYVKLIDERGGAIDCLNAHSFLQQRADLRNHLKSNYQLSNLNEFFHKHPKYFWVEEPYVSIQPVWFLTEPQFPKKEFHSAQFTVGNTSGATNGQTAKNKKVVQDPEHGKIKSDVATILRSVVLSSKEGIPLQKLQEEYAQLVGEPIPFQESGYSSLESMLNEMQDVVRLIRSASGQILVKVVDDSSTNHLSKLIARQKGCKPSPGRQASPQAHAPLKPAVKTFVPFLEKKAILCLASMISQKRHLVNYNIDVKEAKSFLTQASEDVRQYVTDVYAGDPKSLFLRHPECFKVSRKGNIHCPPFKMILEIVNTKTFGVEVVQRSKKSSEPSLPTPLRASPLDSRSESPYSESDSCFSTPTPTFERTPTPSDSPYPPTSKGQSLLLFDTLKNLLRHSESNATTCRDQRTPSSVSDNVDVQEKPQGLVFRELIDLDTLSAIDRFASKKESPRTRDIACQTISTGPILSLSVFNL